MGLKANTGYNFTITGGGMIQSQTKGTPGYQIFLECDAGETDYTIWLTEKNRESAMQALEILGADMSKLSNRVYFEQLEALIRGKEIHGYVVQEEWKGKVTLKIGSISKKRELGPGGLAAAAATFFGAAASGERTVIADDDIPF